MGYSILTNEIGFSDKKRNTFDISMCLIDACNVVYDKELNEIVVTASNGDIFLIPCVTEEKFSKIVLALYKDNKIILDKSYCILYSSDSEDISDRKYNVLLDKIQGLIDSDNVTDITVLLQNQNKRPKMVGEKTSYLNSF